VRGLPRISGANGLLRAAAAPPPRESASTQTSMHPCFGTLVADFGPGQKKVYQASARTLVSTVPIWAKQRPCNEGRVDEIVKAKTHTPSLMGPIMCFEFDDGTDEMLAMPSLMRPQPRAIFDGQHRARAAMRLLSSTSFTIVDGEEQSGIPPEAVSAPEAADHPGPGCHVVKHEEVQATEHEGRAKRSTRTQATEPVCTVEGGCQTISDTTFHQRPAANIGLHSDFHLLVEVYPVTHERQIKDLYLEVNKGESVKEIDLPDAIAPKRKSIIDDACERLQQMYPEMFKPSERCRPPHIHKDTLRNKLFHHTSIEDVSSAADLIDGLLIVNKQLQARPSSSWGGRMRKPLGKALAHDFYLGLEDYAVWLHLL